DGLPDGRAAVLQKVHHTLFDGEAGLRLSLALVDLERDPVPGAHAPLTAPDHVDAGADGAGDAPADGEPRRDTPATVTAHALRDATVRNVGAVRSALGAAGRVLSHPEALPGR